MWSKGAVLATVIGAFLIIIGFMVMGLQMGQPALPGWEKYAILTTLVLLLVLVGFIVFTYPMKITMWEDAFIIRRLGGNKVIRHGDIKSAHRIRKNELDLSGKMFGTSGMIGYWGMLTTPDHGRFRIYSRHLRNMLFLEMRNGRKYVISYTPKCEKERDTLRELMDR
ncbi:MAG: PH domain-containing protein [Alistipes sp.]|nr:PH domain-containing protein [Alistipes sp.]